MDLTKLQHEAVLAYAAAGAKWLSEGKSPRELTANFPGLVPNQGSVCPEGTTGWLCYPSGELCNMQSIASGRWYDSIQDRITPELLHEAESFLEERVP